MRANLANSLKNSVPNDRSNWTEPTVDRTVWQALPKKYEMVHTSGLSAEIKPGLNTGVNFNLD